MKLEPYKLATFGGGASGLVVLRENGCVSYLLNAVSFIDVREVNEKVFETDHLPAKLTDAQVQRMLYHMKAYALSTGMTQAAADILPELINMTDDEVARALAMGTITQAKILGDAEKEYNMDVKNGTVSGKAPRKLGGAALIAQNKRLAREAEAAGTTTETVDQTEAKPPRKGSAPRAKMLAEKVTKNLEAEEAAGATDMTLSKNGSAKARKTVKEALAKPAKAKVEEKPKAVEKAPAKAKTGDASFDVAKMKRADGTYRSSSSMFKALIWDGKLKDDAKIFAAVQKEFPELGADKIGYVAWNRGWFKRNKIALPA